MGVAATSAAPTPVASPRPAGRHGRAAAWYAVFAVYAGGVAAFSGPGLDRWWGIWAVGGYAAAAVLAWCWRSRGRQAALAGDPRPWLAAATFLLLAVAFRAAAQPDPLRRAAFATASPLIAFPIAL